MSNTPSEQKGPLEEIVQPFIDLFNAPRALWGINLAYVLEGMVYFGMLGYLAIHFSDFIFQAMDGADEAAHHMVMILTAGITISMFFLGFVGDKRGVRFALITAFVLMLGGRCLISGAPNVLGLQPTRPGVVAGDTVTLHVERIETINDTKVITKATVLANDDAGPTSTSSFALDLAAGPGTAPSAELESRLVRLNGAKVIEGDGNAWKVEYGSTPVTAPLLATGAKDAGLCIGAVISLDSAYIAYEEETKEWVIRSHWVEDFTEVDKTNCDADAVAAMTSHNSSDELPLKSKKRWPVADENKVAAGASTATIEQLRTSEDGKVDLIVRNAHVTYVRNAGYFLQGEPDGPAICAFVDPQWSWLHIVTLLGMILVVVGYGMYQPAAYAGVRQFTTPKTAAMGFAMLYALMNLGGWFPSFAFLLRDDDFLGLGIPGVFWVYTGFTLIALICTLLILSRKTVDKAIETAKAKTAEIEAAEKAKQAASKAAELKPCPHEGCSQSNPADAQHCSQCGRELKPSTPETTPTALPEKAHVRPHMWLFWLAAIALIMFKGESPWFFTWGELVSSVQANGLLCGVFIRWNFAGLLALLPVFVMLIPPFHRWLARHPLEDAKFAFFVFCLIPVQTLFTYNWLILPQYIKRAFEGWIGEYFEIAANANPIMIFIAVPIITAMTQKAKVYNMMIYGTFIMAAPAFLLVLGAHWWTLFGYLVIMTIGEAMWQPRFLQYAAEIAPEGRTGEYMGVAQLPWFLTKVLVPLLYSGQMMDRYCPAEGVRHTEMMWFIFGCIAITSCVMLVLAKGWIGKDFKTKHG